MYELRLPSVSTVLWTSHVNIWYWVCVRRWQGEWGGSQAGSSLCCQRQKLLNYEIAILHQTGAFWVAVHVCFSLRKTAICLKHVLPTETQKSKMQGHHLLDYLWLLGIKLNHLANDAVDFLEPKSLTPHVRGLRLPKASGLSMANSLQSSHSEAILKLMERKALCFF